MSISNQKPPILRPPVLGTRKTETVTENKVTVEGLLQEYFAGSITLDELSLAFINDVKWDYRGIDGDDITEGNIWLHVYNAVQQDKLKGEDYIKLANDYELAQEAKL
jgi:hypothetical protein